MSFDITEYTKAMDHFLLAMQQLMKPGDPKMAEAVEPLCQALRIAQIYIDFYQDQEHVQQQIKKSTTVYDAGNVDDGRSYAIREITEPGNIADYYACQFSGQEDWSEAERQKIHIFLKTLFAFNGRARVMDLAWELTYKDRDIEIYNLSYFMKDLGGKIARGEIDRYAVCYFNLKRFSVTNQIYGRRSAGQQRSCVCLCQNCRMH